MKQAEIKALLEKYWQAETTLEEERQLAEYFRQPEIAAGLEPARGVFAWREEEAELRPGADFDRRLLERIEEMEGGVTKKIGFSFRFAAAAAIILCLGIGLLIPRISSGPEEGVSRSGPGEGAPRALAGKMRIIEKDTYSDPNQALAAVRRALLVASVRLDKGNHITQKNITRLHDSWQAATGD